MLTELLVIFVCTVVTVGTVAVVAVVAADVELKAALTSVPVEVTDTLPQISAFGSALSTQAPAKPLTSRLPVMVLLALYAEAVPPTCIS